jgi:hypothetical protein
MTGELLQVYDSLLQKQVDFAEIDQKSTTISPYPTGKLQKLMNLEAVFRIGMSQIFFGDF